VRQESKDHDSQAEVGPVPASRKLDPVTKKRRNLGTFDTREAAQKHERAVQFFKRRG